MEKRNCIFIGILDLYYSCRFTRKTWRIKYATSLANKLLMGAVVLSINTQHLAVDSFITALDALNLHVRDTRAALRSAQ